MPTHPRRRPPFLLRMTLPALTAVLLYICMIAFVIVPAFEKAVMNEREAMIKELTETAWSILQDLHNEELSGRLSRSRAQELARTAIRTLRYGEEGKDYFWVLDKHPRMIAHPYRQDLEGKDVTDFTDPNGKQLFLEFANLVKKQDSGYVEYMWQKQDDPSKIVPKLSYVKGFSPWGWIVGTGVYIEDVHDDIQKLTDDILLISIGIICLIGGIILFIVLQGKKIETARQLAETNLIESKEKYQALVEASSDGFIMLIDNRDMITNTTLVSMLGYDEAGFSKLALKDIIAREINGQESPGFEYIQTILAGRPAPAQFNAGLIRRDGEILDVIMTASTIDFSGRSATIFIARDISDPGQLERRRAEDERNAIIAELQTALHFLNLNIRDLIHEAVPCSIDTSIHRAALLMSQRKTETLLVTAEDGRYLGIVTDYDLRERAIAKQLPDNTSVTSIMTAPIITIPERALVFEAALVMNDADVSCLAVEDSTGQICGMINQADLLKLQGYSAVSLIQSIQRAQTPEEIAMRHEKLPMLVKAFLDTGSQPQNVTRIISNLSDIIIRKLINFAIAELGEPPVGFAFVVLGSVAREEQTLSTDQDNGIIFDDNIPAEKIDDIQNYFLALSRKVCGWLDDIGYRYCDGDIMAQNPNWCQPLSTWKEYFTRWIHTAEPQDMLEINIFFDFRCVYGNNSMVESLRQHIQKTWQEHPLFIFLLAENALRYRPPLNLFGGIKGNTSSDHHRSFDIKDSMMPIVNIARAQALKHHVSETNTLDRVYQLFEQKVFSEHEYNEILLVYNFLMQLRLKHQAMKVRSGSVADNYITIAALTDIEKNTLKTMFHKISDFLAKLKVDFQGRVQ